MDDLSPEKVDSDQIDNILEHLIDNYNVEGLRLFIAQISHEPDLFEKNEAVLVGRAIINFHSGNFKFVLICLVLFLQKFRKIIGSIFKQVCVLKDLDCIFLNLIKIFKT